MFKFNFKIFFGIIALLVCFAVVFYVGLKPKAISKIKFSQTKEDHQVTEALWLRFNLELKTSKLWIIGIEAEHRDIVIKWLDEILGQGIAIKSVFCDEHIPCNDLISPLEQTKLPKPLQGISIMSSYDTIYADKSAADNEKIIVLTSPEYSTRMIAGSYRTQLESRLLQTKNSEQISIVSFSFVKFARSAGEEKFLRPCHPEAIDPTGENAFACQIMRSGRLHYSKKAKKDHWAIKAEQIALNDYLVLLAKE